MSAREDVLTRLGGNEGAAGEAVVRFVEQTLVSNREELARLADEHNQRVASFEARVAEFVSTAQLDEVRGDVAGIRRQLAAAAAALGGAVSAHNQAVADASDTSVEAAQAATAEAEEAGQQAQAGIEELETRVSDLERWRQEEVDPQLKQLREDVDQLKENDEKRGDPLKIIPVSDEPVYPGPEPEQPAANEPAPQPHPTRQLPVAVRRADPRNWGTSPWPWIIAVIGAFLGWLLVGGLFEAASRPTMWDWVAWLAHPIFALVGFFGGGAIGVYLVESQADNRPAEA